jgi:hypothetical protein
MLVSVDPFFDSMPDQLAALAVRYRVPTVYTLRDYVEADLVRHTLRGTAMR